MLADLNSYNLSGFSYKTTVKFVLSPMKCHCTYNLKCTMNKHWENFYCTAHLSRVFLFMLRYHLTVVCTVTLAVSLKQM